MLYVFQVDSGTMRTFNMTLALETVSCLQNEIEQTCKVVETDQVLLISGGESLDPNARVCTYNAGTDTNPIFLFNKSAIESIFAAPRISNPQLDVELMESVKSAMGLPVALSTVVSRTDLSQKCYNAAVDIQRSCEQLCHEQHLQQQSWAAVVANLDDVTSAFENRAKIFNSNFMDYLKTRDSNIKLLQKFNEDLMLLSKIPLLPALLENDSISSSSEICSIPENLSLLQWISSKDNQSSLEQVAEQCLRGLEQFDEKIHESLDGRIKESLVSSANMDVKEIKGLQIRLYRLDEFMHTAKDLVKRQLGITQGFMKNCRSANEMKEDSVLPDLCETHRAQLQIILKHHQQLLDIQNRCNVAKQELTTNMHTRLKWIMYTEIMIRDIDNRLVIYHENLKRLKRHLEIIYQVHLAPQIYFELISEVVLRRKFSDTFLKWARNLAEESREMLNEELVRRQKINQRVGTHFLITLFPGLDDLPPAFANEEPVPFDRKLPKIDESDIFKLLSDFPEHKSLLNVPGKVQIPSVETPPSTVIQGKDPTSVSRECYISTSDRATWTFSTSPHEPAPDYQTNESLYRDSVKAAKPKPSAKTSPGSPSGAFDETSESPETGEFLTADFYIDESMPSSYTESNNSIAATSKDSESTVNISFTNTKPLNVQKGVRSSASLINDLKDQLSNKDLDWQQRMKVFVEKAEKSANSNVNLKNEFSSLKQFVLSDTKKYAEYFNQVNTKISNLILNQQNLIDSEKLLLISETKAKLEEENIKIITDLERKLKINRDKLDKSYAERNDVFKKAEKLEVSMAELSSKLADINSQYLVEKDELERKLSSEYEIKINELHDRYLLMLKEKDEENSAQTMDFQNKIEELESQISAMEVKMEAEKEMLTKAFEHKHKEEFESIKQKHEKEMKERIAKVEAENHEHNKGLILDAEDMMNKKAMESLEEQRKFIETENTKTVKKKVTECSAEKEAALSAMHEKLTQLHKREIEGLRSRFKIAVQTSSVMEKSISDSNLEKAEVKVNDTIDVVKHEAIVSKLKCDFADEKKKMFKALQKKHSTELAELQSKFQKEKSDALSPLKTSMTAEKQILFNEAVTKVTAEKDQVIKELKFKIKKMSRTITQLSQKEHHLSNVPESSEEAMHATEHTGARPKMTESMTSSVMTIASYQHEESDNICELKRKLQLKQEQLDFLHEKMMELSVTSSTESLIRADKVSVLSCNIGDVVLLFYDEKYNHYTVFLLSPVLHFLNSDCYASLDLDPSLKSKKMWALAEVVDKEYCQAKKVSNRYKVSVGTKFYRVKAVPWSKELALREEHRMKIKLGSSNDPSTSLSLL